MDYSNEIERIRAEKARLKREIRKSRKRIARIKLEATLSVAIETLKQMRRAVLNRLESIDEYVACRTELSELQSERAAFDIQYRQMFREVILETGQARE